jgi:nucleotide-binding universal stress UspA family protein
MKEHRWLLPFTHGVDMQAIDSAVRLAESSGGTLVAASLVSVAQKPRSRGARLEHIQQSKDFLEAVKWKAARYEVPTERYEVFTADVMQSIAVLMRDQHCDSIVLVTRGGEDVLLQAHEVKHLLEASPASLVLIRLPMQPGRTQTWSLLTRFLSWLPGLWGRADSASQVEDVPAVEEPSWIRTEEHRRG